MIEFSMTCKALKASIARQGFARRVSRQRSAGRYGPAVIFCYLVASGPAMAASFNINADGKVTVDGVVCENVNELVRDDTLTTQFSDGDDIVPIGTRLKVYNMKITCPGKSPFNRLLKNSPLDAV